MRAESGRIHAGEVKRTARKCGPPRNVTVASCRSSHQSRNRYARAHNRLLYVVPALQARSGQVLAIHPLCLVISSQGKAPNHTRQPPLAIITILISILCSSAVLRREEPLDRTTNPCIDLLLRTINVIRQNAPDDIHMSQRYADLLEIFVNAVLRPSAMANNTTPGGNQIEVIGSRLSPNRAESELVESSPLKLGYDWIYDSNFWDTLPEMVGLDSLSDLVLPYFE